MTDTAFNKPDGFYSPGWRNRAKAKEEGQSRSEHPDTLKLEFRAGISYEKLFTRNLEELLFDLTSLRARYKEAHAWELDRVSRGHEYGTTFPRYYRQRISTTIKLIRLNRKTMEELRHEQSN